MKNICLLFDDCDSVARQLAANLDDDFALVHFPQDADVIVRHFCAITQIKLKDIISELAYLSKTKKSASILIVCGCAVTALGVDWFKTFDFIDYVVERENMAEEILKILGATCSNNFWFEDEIGIFDIDIVNGCQKKGGWCNFCKMHYLKVPVKSMPIEEVCRIVEEVTSTHKHSQIVKLCGLNPTNYGIDFGDRKPKLHLLLRELEKIPTLKLIKIFGLVPDDMYEELICEINRNKKVFCVTLGVQSGSANTLQAMNIHSSPEKTEDILHRLSGKIVETLLVIGHPGETDNDVLQTIDFFKRNHLWYTFMSPYINTEGVKSYQMEQLPHDVYHSHVKHTISEMLNMRKKMIVSIVGTVIEGYLLNVHQHRNYTEIKLHPKDFRGNIGVIVEGNQAKRYIDILSSKPSGSILKVKITGVYDSMNIGLKGELIEDFNGGLICG